MPVQRAVDAYTRERMNCAQSVLKAYQETHAVSEEDLAAAKAHGGGRAEGGLCGALHAALALATTMEQKEQIRAEFRRVAGAETCRGIKGVEGSGYPCKDCVALAARLLHETQQP